MVGNKVNLPVCVCENNEDLITDPINNHKITFWHQCEVKYLENCTNCKYFMILNKRGGCSFYEFPINNVFSISNSGNCMVLLKNN